MSELTSRAMAKVFLAKHPLHGAMPFVAAFLRVFPIRVEENPKHSPAYVTPAPEIVLSLDAVERLRPCELRSILLRQALHPAFDVFGRCGQRDPGLWFHAHGLAVNLLVAEEIKRMDRHGLNGQKPGTEPLLCWPDLSHGPDYRFVVDYAYWGKTPEEIYEILVEKRRNGESVPEASDCQPEENGGDTRSGYEKARSLLVHAAMETASAEGALEANGIAEIAMSVSTPRVQWQSILHSEIHQRLEIFERRGFERPCTRHDERETGGMLYPGTFETGFALGVAVDVSGSSHESGVAEAFLSEVGSALQVYEGPVRLMLWDSQVILDRLIEDRSELTRCMAGLKSGGTTNIFSVLASLGATQDDAGRDLPELGMLVVLTDGLVNHWPALDEWPTENVLVAYTREAPPVDYPAVFMEVH